MCLHCVTQSIGYCKTQVAYAILQLTQWCDDQTKWYLLSGLCTHKPLCLLDLKISSPTSLSIIYFLSFPGGQIHWSQSPSETPSAWSPPLSVDVELTAYVLLALLSKPNVTRADLTTASGIVAWLTRQQNAYGGFASTQVTWGWGRWYCLRKILCRIDANLQTLWTLMRGVLVYRGPQVSKF